MGFSYSRARAGVIVRWWRFARGGGEQAGSGGALADDASVGLEKEYNNVEPLNL